MYGSSGCVGGCVKPPPVTTSEKVSKRQRLLRKGGRGRTTHAPKKDWWTSSSNEMENDPNNSRGTQRSVSALNTPNHFQDGRASGNNSTNVTFVNNALMLWNEQRREWVGNRPRHRANQTREPVIRFFPGPAIPSHYCLHGDIWSATYEDLLATSRPFPQPVPLPEMVDFLVDVWEQEGLYE